MIVLHHDYSGYKAYKNHYWREKFMSLSLILKFQKLQFPRALEELVSYLQKASKLNFQRCKFLSRLVPVD